MPLLSADSVMEGSVGRIVCYVYIHAVILRDSQQSQLPE